MNSDRNSERNVSGMKRFLRRFRMFSLGKMREEYETHECSYHNNKIT